MNLLTNGLMNNCGRLFGPPEQFEADVVRVGAERILCEWTVRVDTLAADSGRITGKQEVTELLPVCRQTVRGGDGRAVVSAISMLRQ